VRNILDPPSPLRQDGQEAPSIR